jgi:hypothetical protein
MEEVQDERRVRAAQNQLLFRSVNEQIEAVGEKLMAAAEELDFACECADLACTEKITLSRETFARIKGEENRFMVKAGHEIEEVEDSLEFSDGYVIVVKRGAGAEYVKTHS